LPCPARVRIPSKIHHDFHAQDVATVRTTAIWPSPRNSWKPASPSLPVSSATGRQDQEQLWSSHHDRRSARESVAHAVLLAISAVQQMLLQTFTHLILVFAHKGLRDSSGFTCEAGNNDNSRNRIPFRPALTPRSSTCTRSRSPLDPAGRAREASCRSARLAARDEPPPFAPGSRLRTL